MTIKSFADLPREELLKKPHVAWEPNQLTREILVQATDTLSKWLEASMRELLREGVNQEDVHITHRGGRTVIRVKGVDRYEFKLKFSYGGCNGR